MSDFNRSALVDWGLRALLLLTFAFIFAPIAASFVFSFNVDRFPSLPLGRLLDSPGTSRWLADPLVWEGLRNTLIVGVTVSVLATALGFGAAYTDFRYNFFGKNALSGAGAAAADDPGRHPGPRDAGLPRRTSACRARSTRSSSPTS